MTEIADLKARYQGSRPYPDHVLAFEYSDKVKVTGDPAQWRDELVKAQLKIDEGRKMLLSVKGQSVPATADEMKLPKNAALADALRGARKVIAAGPKDVPRFDAATGKMLAEDAAKLGDWHEAGKLIREPYAQVHLDTLVFRLPARDVENMNWTAFDDAITATRQLSNVLTYKDAHLVDPALDRPSVNKALELLDRTDKFIANALATDKVSPDAGWWQRVTNRLNQLTPTQARWTAIGAISGAALVTGAVGWAAAKD